MRIDMSELQTIQEASFDEDTKCFRILVYCSEDQVMSTGTSLLQRELEEVVLSVPITLRT